VELLRRALFPGFFDEQRLASRTVRYHAGELLSRLRELVYDQVRQALRNHRNREGLGLGDACTECDDEAHLITMRFLARLPEVRRLLASDVQAGYDGDPAAESTDEVIFCYPGLDATFIQRVAHELYRLKVPLLPRIMTEYAHNETGIDIHPGAVLGESFFIDHGTGVVIGETTVIGARVKVYQGVTLGALSTKGGQRLRGVKRHPTIEDDVTLYGGAVILGGQTVIGRGSTIGGAVFLTKSVPPNHTVVIKDGEVRMVGPQL
jgi:serine O-acetyltransferase